MSNPEKAEAARDPSAGSAELIAKALAAADDFGHEMRVKGLLESNGGKVVHGWTYLDPLEQKPRQFDLRCRIDEPQHGDFHLRLAVECKNLAAEAPLIVSGSKRTRAESFHDFVVSDPSAGGVRIRVMRVQADSYLYRQDQFVGKSLLRLKPNRDGTAFVPASALESEIYSRWTQALSSADELCKAAGLVAENQTKVISTLILPLVIVPDGSLWTVEYGNDGAIASGPLAVPSATMFVNHEVVVRPKNNWMNLTHVHFFTFSGLRRFLAELHTGPWSDWFPASATQHQPPVH